MDPLYSAWLSSTWAVLTAALLQPWAAAVFGAFMGGWAMGASKNRTAISEIVRGVGVGISAGAFIWFVQTMILKGVGA